MLSLLKWFIKSAVFALIVVIAANFFKWNGKTISDQVKTQLAQAERADLTSKVRNWAGSVTNDARRGASRKLGLLAIEPSLIESSSAVGISRASQGQDQLNNSERQKLRALIRELNTAPGGE